MSKQPEFSFTNKAGETPAIYIYDAIGPEWAGMVSAKSVVRALAEIGKVPELRVHINSPGGDVFQGIAIYNALARSGIKNVIVQVDGLAASAASLVAMAGHEIHIANNAFVMIHNAMTFAGGNSREMRKAADTLEQIDSGLLDTYVARTGLKADTVKSMLDAETWFTADQAVKNGFADKKLDAPAVHNRFDLSFKNTPAIFIKQDTVKAEATEDSLSTTPEPWWDSSDNDTTVEPAIEGTPEPVVPVVEAPPRVNARCAEIRLELERQLAA